MSRQAWMPKTLSKTSDANLDCVFVESALFYTKSCQQNRIELVTIPGPNQTTYASSLLCHADNPKCGSAEVGDFDSNQVC